jgi:hypothetical protein
MMDDQDCLGLFWAFLYGNIVIYWQTLQEPIQMDQIRNSILDVIGPLGTTSENVVIKLHDNIIFFLYPQFYMRKVLVIKWNEGASTNRVTVTTER